MGGGGGGGVKNEDEREENLQLARYHPTQHGCYHKEVASFITEHHYLHVYDIILHTSLLPIKIIAMILIKGYGHLTSSGSEVRRFSSATSVASFVSPPSVGDSACNQGNILKINLQYQTKNVAKFRFVQWDYYHAELKKYPYRQ